MRVRPSARVHRQGLPCRAPWGTARPHRPRPPGGPAGPRLPLVEGQAGACPHGPARPSPAWASLGSAAVEQGSGCLERPTPQWLPHSTPGCCPLWGLGNRRNRPSASSKGCSCLPTPGGRACRAPRPGLSCIPPQALAQGVRGGPSPMCMHLCRELLGRRPSLWGLRLSLCSRPQWTLQRPGRGRPEPRGRRASPSASLLTGPRQALAT